MIQLQYLRALLGYWADPARNPVSEAYGGRMLDLAHTYAWAWDARPYPAFPRNRALWSDGANYARGHWLTGRMSARTLASVVAEICRRAGITAFDVSRLHGLVRGYAVEDVSDAPAALQPLMLRYGFDALDRDGALVFLPRGAHQVHALDPSFLVDTPEVPGTVERIRSAEAEQSGRLRLRFVEAEADFEVASEESVLPDERTHAVATSELALSMTRPEARQVVERWLAEARIARDTLRFALPPSRGDLGPGDLIRLDQPDMAGTYRIDAVEIGPYRIAEAQRIEPAVYHPLDMVDEVPPAFDFVPPIPPLPLFLDLPLLSGQEQEHAPHLAVTAAPWPGAMALYAASGGEDFALVGLYGRPATVGTLVTALPAASPALLDNGAPVQIRLSRGTLQSVSIERLLAGANLAAIGDGSPEGWEVIQFATAELVAPGEFMLSRRVRGRNGSDAEMAPTHPEGSYFVLLDQSVEQIPFASGDRGVQRNYRIGPARRAIDDPTYVAQAHAFRGLGLRPLSPVHLRLTPSSAGHDLTWIRRTRIDGDTWDGFDVPLGEESELYRVRVQNGSTILREVMTSEPRWSYTTADRTADAPPIGAELEVAQISARYGAGASARLSL